MGKMLQFCRQDSPPPTIRVIPIIKIGPEDRGHAIILSNSMFGIYTHWNGQKTEPCMGDHKHCDLCKKGLPRRWAGFVHCCTESMEKNFFIELTALAGQKLIEVQGKQKTLRGMVCIFFREKKQKRAPLTVTLVRIFPDLEALPAPQDPAKTLQRLWGLENLR